MAYDSYCAICGSQAEVADVRLDDAVRDLLELEHGEEIPDIVQEGYLFEPEDVEFEGDLVTIGPYDVDEDGYDRPIFGWRKLMLGEDGEREALRRFNHNDVKMLADFRPDDERHQEGILSHPDEENPHKFHVSSEAYPMLHSTCFDLLASWTGFTAQTWWRTYSTVNLDYVMSKKDGFISQTLMHGIDYFEIDRAQEQFVLPLVQYEDEERGDALVKEMQEAVETGQLSETGVRDYWMGSGKLFVFKPPNLLPEMEAYTDTQPALVIAADAEAVVPDTPLLQKLPSELLLRIFNLLPAQGAFALLSTCKALRLQLWPHLNTWAECYLHLHAPWALPAKSEIMYWDRNFAKLIEEGHAKAGEPYNWLGYVKVTEKSVSMLNRHRVWKICMQMKKVGEDRGFLTA